MKPNALLLLKTSSVLSVTIIIIGSVSTPVLDTGDTGDIYFEIRWATPKVLWGNTNRNQPTYNVEAGLKVLWGTTN
jgi:hypothetical protein